MSKPTREQMIDALVDSEQTEDWPLEQLLATAEEFVRDRFESMSEKKLRRLYAERVQDACGCVEGILVMTGNDPIDVQRCDDCGIYTTDEAAAEALISKLRSRQ